MRTNALFFCLQRMMPMVGDSSRHFHIVVEVVHVHLHLAQVLMGEFTELEIDEHVTAKKAVVENQVHEEMLFIESEAALPGLEEKAFAEFEQESLDLADDGGFEVGFGKTSQLVEAEKFEHQGFLEQVLRANDDLPFLSELADALFVPAEGEAFVEAGIELGA